MSDGFIRKKGSHAEVTDLARNERLLATLTHRSWRGFSVMETRTLLYELVDHALATEEHDPLVWEKIEHPMKELLHGARQSSGSVKGEHRKDLVEAIKAASPPPTVGLSVPPSTGNEPAQEEPRRRGF